jgi:hypothetical protein
MNKIAGLGAVVVLAATTDAAAQCPPAPSNTDSTKLALAYAYCLGDSNPSVRDRIAFESLSTLLRSGALERETLVALERTLLGMVAQRDPAGFQQPFAALALAEVARTDRIKPWMSTAERAVMVDAAATFLSGVTDYRAFNDKEGFRHGVAHGADFALQLALNPAITKPQLDKLLSAIATQIAPGDPGVAYWAGEPDRLARAVVFIAQRKLHTDAEWNAWFQTVMNPKPLSSWDVAFTSEAGIRKHHNVRAFLLSVFATATTSDDAGIRQLAGPTRDSLKLVP